MPRVKRFNLPDALMRHLSLRMKQRQVSAVQLIAFSRWLDANPIVPSGKWFKRFDGFTVCGEGELVKTFLAEGQLPDGTEVR